MATDWRGLIGAKTVQDLVAQSFERLRDTGSAITNLNVGGVMRTLLELCAQGLADLYDLLVAVVAQGYVRYATGQWLDARAADLGLTRLSATRTEGLLRFYRGETQGNVLISSGVLVSTQTSPQGDRLRYTVTSDTVLPDGESEVFVPVRAESPGTRYNVAPGLITELVTHVEGVDGVVNDVPDGATTWITSEGTDLETDEHLRQRCLLRWYELTRGATRDAYIAWAMSVPGVTDVSVLDRFPRGPGTVDVIITSSTGAPSPDLIQRVQSYIEARRPICADVLVRGPVARLLTLRVWLNIPLDRGDEAVTRAWAISAYNSLLADGSRPDIPRLRIGQHLYLGRLVEIGMRAPDVLNAGVLAPHYNVFVAPDELIGLAAPVEIIIERKDGR